ncbi:hypothetical protein KC726_03845 [Candidatus Woesebacteria bacterium]|nr:hypothetical protein [Candidatus Woesebacteria bacterium]
MDTPETSPINNKSAFDLVVNINTKLHNKSTDIDLPEPFGTATVSKINTRVDGHNTVIDLFFGLTDEELKNIYGDDYYVDQTNPKTGETTRREKTRKELQPPVRLVYRTQTHDSHAGLSDTPGTITEDRMLKIVYNPYVINNINNDLVKSRLSQSGLNPEPSGEIKPYQDSLQVWASQNKGIVDQDNTFSRNTVTFGNPDGQGVAAQGRAILRMIDARLSSPRPEPPL